MLTLKSLLLPVTRYCWVRNAVVPSFCLRYGFAIPPLLGLQDERTQNGLTTDLQRTYNVTASEGVESSLRISLKPVLSWGNVFGMVFSPLHRFSCILNKVNLAGINAYCYAIETVSRLYPALQFMHNNLIIFALHNHKQD